MTARQWRPTTPSLPPRTGCTTRRLLSPTLLSPPLLCVLQWVQYKPSTPSRNGRRSLIYLSMWSFDLSMWSSDLSMWSFDLSMWSFDLSMWSKIFFLEILCIDVMSVSINVSYIYRTECVSHINVPTHTCTCTHTFTHTFTPTPTHTCPSYLSINVCVTCQSDSFSRTGCCTLVATR